MNVVVFKLANGTDVIGRAAISSSLESSAVDSFLIIHDPMEIERGVEGMKLRDILMLADQEQLIIRMSDVITYYKPIDVMCDYYTKALAYAKNYTKLAVAEQIKVAVKELEETMRQEEEYSDSLTRFLLKAAGSTTIQ